MVPPLPLAQQAAAAGVDHSRGRSRRSGQVGQSTVGESFGPGLATGPFVYAET